MQAFIDILASFGFREMRQWIIAICSFMFIINFLGGMISAMFFINSKALELPKLTTRISFRMFLLSEIALVFSAVYYHTFMVGKITSAHVVYWMSSAMMMPLLAVIGAQLLYIMFSGRMRQKKRALKELKRRAMKAGEDAKKDEADTKRAIAKKPPVRSVPKKRR